MPEPPGHSPMIQSDLTASDNFLIASLRTHTTDPSIEKKLYGSDIGPGVGFGVVHAGLIASVLHSV